MLAATVVNVGGQKYQIATNRESTVTEVADMLISALAAEGVNNIQVIHSEAKVGDVLRNYSDISKAKEQLGWGPCYDLVSGLEKTVRYFMKNGTL